MDPEAIMSTAQRINEVGNSVTLGRRLRTCRVACYAQHDSAVTLQCLHGFFGLQVPQVHFTIL